MIRSPLFEDSSNCDIDSSSIFSINFIKLSNFELIGLASTFYFLSGDRRGDLGFGLSAETYLGL